MGAPGAAEVVPLASRAGVVTRVLAACVDAVAVVLLAVALDLTAAGIRFVWSPGDFRWPQFAVLTMAVALQAIAAVYMTVGWSMAGRTYGSRLMGLRVLSAGSGLLGWTRSGLRALACVVFPVGLLWCAVSRTRSSLQDIVVRSVVVYDAHAFVTRSG